MTGRLATAKIKFNDFDGPYLWAGTEFDARYAVYMPGGFIEEYSNGETFCTSWIFHPGLSLLGDGALGVLYLLFLVWLFIGIAIMSDIFMEAIEVITSKSAII